MRNSLPAINIININGQSHGYPGILQWRRMTMRRAAHALATLWAMHEKARQRRALASLDDGQLDDIGLSREEATAEATKRFWQD